MFSVMVVAASGAIALTVTAFRANARASDLASKTMPALAAP
jgi:hypothetical protein